MAVALNAPDIRQVLVALHQGVIVCLLVQLSVHQRPLLLTCLRLQQKSHGWLSRSCETLAGLAASTAAQSPLLAG